MKANHKFRRSVYLVIGSKEFDLHNDYDFARVEYLLDERKVIMNWKRSADRPNTLPTSITIQFLDVSRFEFQPRDPAVPFTEDDCLSSAGYFTGDARCKEVFDCDEESDPKWMRLFHFMSGATIMVQADQSIATIAP